MRYFPDYSGIIIQELSSAAWLSSQKGKIAMLRLDRLHPEISGNKWFKLKYNLEAARQENKNTILTFGGAWSNHIAATAAACDLLGFHGIGIIRGQNINTDTLVRAEHHGMQLHFISREQYRRKDDPEFLSSLSAKYDNPYIIPEGGNNLLGIKGCKEIPLFYREEEYTHICCPVGTGTTLAGLMEYYGEGARPAPATSPACVGFPALKNAGYLKEKIADNLPDTWNHGQLDLVMDYHFGGFAKKTPELIAFIKNFYTQHHILLDFVYTAKMMYGITDLLQKGYFPPGSRILAIHTGGLQGNRSLGIDHIQ